MMAVANFRVGCPLELATKKGALATESRYPFLADPNTFFESRPACFELLHRIDLRDGACADLEKAKKYDFTVTQAGAEFTARVVRRPQAPPQRSKSCRLSPFLAHDALAAAVVGSAVGTYGAVISAPPGPRCSLPDVRDRWQQLRIVEPGIDTEPRVLIPTHDDSGYQMTIPMLFVD